MARVRGADERRKKGSCRAQADGDLCGRYRGLKPPGGGTTRSSITLNGTVSQGRDFAAARAERVDLQRRLMNGPVDNVIAAQCVVATSVGTRCEESG